MFLRQAAPELLRADRPAARHRLEGHRLACRFVLRQPRQIFYIFAPARWSVLQAAGMIERRAGLIPGRPHFWLSEPVQARPRPGRQFSHPTQLRAHGIEVDVVAQRSQPRARIHRQRLVAALEQMPLFLAQPVEARGEGPLQPAHPVDQIRLRSLQREVVVVRHQAPRVHPPAGLLTSLTEACQKRRLRLLPSKDIRAIVSTVDHVVDRSLLFHPQLARHRTELSPAPNRPSTPNPKA